MARYRFYRRVFDGGPLFGAGLSTAVTVLDSDTDLKVTVYDAETGGSPLSNPFFLTEVGKFDFWAEEGNYRVTAVNGSNTDSWEGRIGPYPGGGGGNVESVVAGDGINVDSTDPDNPIVSSDFTSSDTDAAYTLSATNNKQWMDVHGGANVNITCPSESSVDLGDKFVHVISVLETDTTVTFVAGAGVTVISPAGGTLIAPQNSTVGVKKSSFAADTYIVFGPTEAV